MIAAVIGLLLPVLAGSLGLRALRLRVAGDSVLLTTSLGGVAGLGLSSVVVFWCAVLGLTIGPWFAGVDAIAWTAIGVVAWRKVSGRPAPTSPRLTPADWLVRVAFAAIAAIALATAIAHNVAAPHGEWDAWAIWNQKARFLARDIDHWTAMMDIPWSNPSHPFLVSFSVARLWAYAGSETTFVPAMLGIVWGAGIVAVVMGALDTRRKRAWIAGSVLVAPATFPQLASAQTADLAVSLFVVATLAVLRSVVMDPNADPGDTRRRLLLGGVLASLAGWTKNEGLVLLVIATIIVGWMTLRSRQVRQLAWWVAGAGPVAATIVWFKLVLAPQAPAYMLPAEGSFSVTARLFDPARHVLVGSLIGPYWMNWGGPLATGALILTIAVALWAAALRGGASARVLLIAIVLMFTVYDAVWVLSPLDTTWLVATTFDRLMMHLWPTVVLAAFGAGDQPLEAPSRTLVA